MTMAQVIDGKAIAAQVLAGVAADVASLKREHGLTPGLAVVMVGVDPASQIYVRNKGQQTTAAGMRSIGHNLPAATSERHLLELIGDLNRADEVHGILVQLPLPAHIDARKVIEAIDPDKDVDGFHPINAGRLAVGEKSLVPCTPAGAMILARWVEPNLAGLHAVIVGRSNIVGKPMAQLLLAADCTVTIAHSKTRDLPSIVRQADVLVAAVGRPEFVQGDWIKRGAIVIDVGINRLPANGGKSKLVGDVDFASAVAIARAITPVPGGVGPMTIACLLRNTVDAARLTVAGGPTAS